MKRLIPVLAVLAVAGLAACERPTSTSSTTVVKEPTAPTSSTTVVQPAPPAPSSTVVIDATKPAPATESSSTSTTRVDTPAGTAVKRETQTTTTK